MLLRPGEPFEKFFCFVLFSVVLQHLRASEVLPSSGQRKGKFPASSSPLLTLPLWKRCWLTLGVPSRVAQEYAIPRPSKTIKSASAGMPGSSTDHSNLGKPMCSTLRSC